MRGPVLAVICLVLAALAVSPPANYLARLGGDFLLPLAARFVGERAASRVTLVVIDETTHATPPFSETPAVAWTPYLGRVMKAIAKADPAVVGLNIIYPKSLDGPGLLPGYDMPFLQALSVLAESDKLVMSEARLSESAIRPYRGQILAAGGDRNVRPVHLTPDADNIIRRHPAALPREDGAMTRSFAGELAARAGAQPVSDILIDFLTPAERFDAYRLSDLHACLDNGATDFTSLFEDRVVIIGTFLDIEDRHIAANRFAARKTPPILAPDCRGGAAPTTAAAYRRGSVPGAMIEARAAHSFLENSSPSVAPAWLVFLISAALFALLAAIFFVAAPALSLVALAVAIAAFAVSGGYFYAHGTLLPALPWALGAAALFPGVNLYRVIVEDRKKRWITHAFRHYLSPELVDRLADDPDSLKLGGERRRVAVLFADLAGFTGFSEELADQPEKIVEHLNEFFEIMSRVTGEHGGYVDKFIGDAVMVVWGAPAPTEEPEKQAVAAALACIKALEACNAARAAAGDERRFHVRIGVGAGEVVAGNLGAAGRFNYTVIGDAVNRAARLQAACKERGVATLVDEAVAARLGAGARARFIGEGALRGVSAPVRLFTLDRE